MNKFVIAVCLIGGAFYTLVGVLLFCAPSFFFYRVVPIRTLRRTLCNGSRKIPSAFGSIPDLGGLD